MKWVLAALLLAGCAPVQLGTVPRPDELLIGRKVDYVWPLDNGHYLAISGDWYCPLDIDPVGTQEGTVIACRWRRDVRSDSQPQPKPIVSPTHHSGITVTQAAEGLIAADCITTAIGLYGKDSTYEMNPILGRHPSPLRLGATCVASGVGLALLPRKIRRPVAFAVVILQVYNVIWEIGLIGHHK